MRLSDYLRKTGESETAFAARVGAPRSTINAVARGARPRADLADRIIKATEGEVALEDLAGGPSLEDRAAASG